jgi:uncharacterized integral membrane protein
MMQKIRWFFLLIGITLVLLLLLWNSSAVTVKFPFVAELQLPLSILLFTTSLLSFILGAIMTGWSMRRRYKAAAKAEAAKSKLDKKSESSAPQVLGSQTTSS